ncbi:uncharacterized protein AAES06_021619 [Glossophaga mutica]
MLHPGREGTAIGQGKTETEVFWADGTARAKALRWEEASSPLPWKAVRSAQRGRKPEIVDAHSAPSLLGFQRAPTSYGNTEAQGGAVSCGSAASIWTPGPIAKNVYFPSACLILFSVQRDVTYSTLKNEELRSSAQSYDP